MFSKFVRGEGIAQVQPDGSGLGLYIAKRIVDAHKGEIWVESEGLGKGSTFIFTLPGK
ncbi:MAG: ATP-binding protein [Candidatus Uhrbacteria bacterium]|nr:ATP-binding protein [Candidatus Uhrbacteria bacterium]